MWDGRTHGGSREDAPADLENRERMRDKRFRLSLAWTLLFWVNSALAADTGPVKIAVLPGEGERAAPRGVVAHVPHLIGGR